MKKQSILVGLKFKIMIIKLSQKSIAHRTPVCYN